MKTVAFVLLSVFAGVVSAADSAADAVNAPIDIDATGLEKTSPFDTAEPAAFEMGAGLYRSTEYGAPAMIPHAVDMFRIQQKGNPCMQCHGNVKKIGAPKEKGQPVAMPKSHWTTVKGKTVMDPSRHECLLCHAPQADVKPLGETVH